MSQNRQISSYIYPRVHNDYIHSKYGATTSLRATSHADVGTVVDDLGLESHRCMRAIDVATINKSFLAPGS